MEEKTYACAVCAGSALRTIDRRAGLCRCGACGHIFHNPRPSTADIAAFYSHADKYDAWLEHGAARDRLWERRLRLMLPWIKPGSLLDVGTGTGQFLAHARPHFSRIEGTEVSESAVRIAREKYHLSIMRAFVEDVRDRDGSFDNVTLFHVLEHVPGPRATVMQCASLLTNGGMLFIAVPNEILSPRRRLSGFAKFALGRAGVRRFRRYGALGVPEIALDGTQDEIHLSYFRPRILHGLLEGCGFRVVHAGLDPFYAARGLPLAFESALYSACRAIHAISGINLYDTIWMVARKE
jgi:SAM-dependent methyltransferase